MVIVTAPAFSRTFAAFRVSTVSAQTSPTSIATRPPFRPPSWALRLVQWSLMGLLIDLAGQRFGRLLALSHSIEARRTFWLCRCDCGVTVRVGRQNLRSGATTSCGCWAAESTAARSTTHGLRRVPEYAVWAMMRQRCNNPNFPAYKHYGGRGITICERWHQFTDFYADMGSRPSPEHELDRINNDGPYSPENCRWTTSTVNRNNTRRNRWLEYDGERLTIAEWSRRTGISYGALTKRLRRGWSTERVLTIPTVRRRGFPR